MKDLDDVFEARLQFTCDEQLNVCVLNFHFFLGRLCRESEFNETGVGGWNPTSGGLGYLAGTDTVVTTVDRFDE